MKASDLITALRGFPKTLLLIDQWGQYVTDVEALEQDDDSWVIKLSNDETAGLPLMADDIIGYLLDHPASWEVGDNILSTITGVVEQDGALWLQIGEDDDFTPPHEGFLPPSEGFSVPDGSWE